MVKLVIFDLDGVLLDSREIHYEALNRALVEFGHVSITREDHLSTFDGLPTSKKLDLLATRNGVPKAHFDGIWAAKQRATVEIFQSIRPDPELISIFMALKQRGLAVAVASNSVRNTVKLALLKLGILEYVDYFVSNEDVKRTKPFPEMYWAAMTALGAIPRNTVIIEDSHIGRRGALDSGAHLIPVEDRSSVTYRIVEKIMNTFTTEIPAVPWLSETLNVLIPMAGAGSRFANAGYTFPKPLIEVHGRPMIDVVVRNLNIKANFIFLVQQDHYQKYDLGHLLNRIAPDCKIVLTDGLTQGAACTTLLAREFIDNDAPLVIANSDQFLEWDANETLYAFTADGIDGGIVTFEANHPKWSFARLGEDGFVAEVAEKKVISNLATVGVYYWRKGADYVRYADQMIDKDIRVNNEFYVCPVFNEAIADGKKIRAKNASTMWGIGTPEDLTYFLENYTGRV